MAAVLNSTTPKSIYATPGENYAPVRSLEALGKPDYYPCKLADKLQEKYERLSVLDDEVWREYMNTGRLVANLREGKLMLMRSVRDGRYLFAKREGRFADNKTVGGLFQFYSTSLTSSWIASKPEIDPIYPSSDDQVEEFIDTVKVVQDHYSRKFWDDVYEQQESLSAQDFGTWITRYRFDPDVKDLVCELLPFPACRWDLRFIPEESSFFIYASKCSTAKLEHILKAGIDADAVGSQPYGLQVLEQISRQGSNVAGWGKERILGNANSITNENVVVEMWLKPEQYCDIILDGDEQGLGGTVKEGNLMDTFPNGLCAVGINDMKTIIGLYAEDHKDHIVSGVYHLQSFVGVGKGISDSVDIIKDMNDLHSQTLTYIKAHSTPATYYNQDLISEDAARNIGKPAKAIPVDFKNAPEGVTNINQAVQAISPQNPAQSVFAYKDVLNSWLQMSMQVTNFSNGMPEVDNTTATGVRAGESRAQMILVPQLRNKASHRKRSSKVVWNLFKRYMSDPKWFSTRDKNPITRGLYVTGTQWDGVDIDFEIVANTEIPKSPYSQQEALGSIMAQSGGIVGLIQAAQLDPNITGEVIRAFGGTIDLPTRKDIARICRRRVEQARQILELELANQKVLAPIGIPFDNTDLPDRIVSQISPPISPKEMYAQQKAQWLAELLDSDELQYAPVELRYVIEAMIDRQLETATLGQAQLQQDQDIASVMAQLPIIAGAQAMDEQNQRLQLQMQQAQQTQQQEQQTLLAQQQGQIDEKLAQADHARNMELAQVKAQGKPNVSTRATT